MIINNKVECLKRRAKVRNPPRNGKHTAGRIVHNPAKRLRKPCVEVFAKPHNSRFNRLNV